MSISFAGEVRDSFFDYSQWEGFLWGLSLYGAVLFMQVVLGTLSKREIFKKKDFQGTDLFFPLSNSLLLLFLLIYHFVFASHLIYTSIPFISHFQCFLSFLSLFFYFLGLWVFYYSSYSKDSLDEDRKGITKKEEVFSKIRFLLPFAIPFLLFSFYFDIIDYIFFSSAYEFFPEGFSGFWRVFAFVLCAFIFLAITVVFFPFLLQRLWKCKSLDDLSLKSDLERMCLKGGFKHAGLKLWPAANGSLSAAIVGVLPAFRYVIFSRRLIEVLSKEQTEAVLAHEIGHSKYKHLFFYPLLIFALLIMQGFFIVFFGSALNKTFSLLYLGDHSSFWKMLYPLILFCIHAVMVLSYFRLAYGFFSRNFERQADLYVFELGVPSKYLVEALNRIAILSGYVHEKPSWHHFSIQQRIDFLKEAEKNPSVIEGHHKRVAYMKRSFFFLVLFFALLFSTVFVKNHPFASSIGSSLSNVGHSVEELSSRYMKKKLAKDYFMRYDLERDNELIEESLLKGFDQDRGDRFPGIAEFYAAQNLFMYEEYQPAIVLMVGAWRNFDSFYEDFSLWEEFIRVSLDMLEIIEKQEELREDGRLLLDLMHSILVDKKPIDNSDL